MTLLTLKRIYDNENETLGMLYLNGELECFILEDEPRAVKVSSETRIPRGIYRIKLRNQGSMNEKYMDKFEPGFHLGMLHLQEVPNFEYIYIHIGNDDDDTSGCLLTGCKSNIQLGEKIVLEDSTVAYKRLYSKIISKIDELYIEII